MSKVRLTEYERETILGYNNAEKTGSVYTCNPTLMRKLEKLVAEHPGEIELIRQDEVSVMYKVPKEWIVVRPPKKMNITEEQREQKKELIKKARERKSRC